MDFTVVVAREQMVKLHVLPTVILWQTGLQSDEMVSALQLWSVHKLCTYVFGLSLMAAVLRCSIAFGGNYEQERLLQQLPIHCWIS